MLDIDYDKLKAELRAELEAEVETDVEVEKEHTLQSQYNKQINYNALTQKQLQGQLATTRTQTPMRGPLPLRKAKQKRKMGQMKANL